MMKNRFIKKRFYIFWALILTFVTNSVAQSWVELSMYGKGRPFQKVRLRKGDILNVFNVKEGIIWLSEKPNEEEGVYAIHSNNGYVLDGDSKKKIKLKDMKEVGGGWYEYDFGKKLYFHSNGSEAYFSNVRVLPYINRTTQKNNSAQTIQNTPRPNSTEKTYSVNIPIQDLSPTCPIKSIYTYGNWGSEVNSSYRVQSYNYGSDIDYKFDYIDDAVYFSTQPNTTSVDDADYIVKGHYINTPDGIKRMGSGPFFYYQQYHCFYSNVYLYFIKATPEVYKYESWDKYNNIPRMYCEVELTADDWVKTFVPNPDKMSFDECKDAICKLDNLVRFNYEETDYFKFLLSKYEGSGDVKLLTKAGREELNMIQYEKDAQAGDIDAALKIYAKKGIEKGYPLLKELLLRDWNTLKWSRKAGNMNYSGFTGLVNDLSTDLVKANPALGFEFHKAMFEQKKLPEAGLELMEDYETGRGTTKNPTKAFLTAKQMRQMLINEPLSRYSRQMTTCKLIDYYWTGTGTPKNPNEGAKLLMEVTANGVGLPQCYDFGDHKQDKCTMRYRLGLTHEYGYGGVTKNISEALEFYEAAYSGGAFGLKDSPQAAYKLAYWTEKGRGYITDRITRRPDIRRARALYQYATQYGNATTKVQAKQALTRIGY